MLGDKYLNQHHLNKVLRQDFVAIQQNDAQRSRAEAIKILEKLKKK